MRCILWNRRPGPHDLGSIDELVIDDVAVVHIEQTGYGYWIGVTTRDGGEWSGNFMAAGAMRLVEQHNDGVAWDSDRSHTDEDERDRGGVEG